jgi:hypothetical protein
MRLIGRKRGKRGIPFWELILRESCFFLDTATYLNEDDRNALMRSFDAHFEHASVALNEKQKGNLCQRREWQLKQFGFAS